VPAVVLSGADTALGRRVTDRLAANAGAVAVILDGPAAAVRRALDEASASGVEHLVYQSSATVYGAWPDNPVPLSETIALRPNPGAPFAVGHAEGERLVADWKAARPGSTATVLRPTTTVTPGERTRLSPLLAGYAGVAVRGASRPVQAVHVDDVAAAVSLAVDQRLDGIFNVAPDGWIADSIARAVAGGPLRLSLPRALVERVTRLSPAVLAYTMHPWVVANDRLRAEGWKPEHSNEEALVATQAASWRDFSPRRRQELALGVTGLTLAGSVAGAIALIRRHSRRT
jgi:nucleoside-diphosphate-sugar epimerase